MKSVSDAAQTAGNLAAVLRVATAVTSSLDLERILSTACQSAVELLGVSHSSFVLFDDDARSGTVHTEFPASVGARGLEIPLRGVPAEDRLIESGEPLVIEDVANAKDLGAVHALMTNLGICSVLIVPVICRSHIIGSLSLDAIGEVRVFTDQEIELCKVFAAQVAIAIENARSLEESKRRAEQLEALRLTTLAITSQPDRQALLRTIIEQAVALLRAQSGAIYEYNSDRAELTIVADYRESTHLGRTLQLGEGTAGRLVATGDEYIILRDYNMWPGRAPVYLDGRAHGALMEVPLKWQQRVIGVLSIADDVGREFAPEEAYLLRLFADQAATALVNASLIAKEQENRKKEALVQLSRELLGTVNPQEILNRAVVFAARVLEVDFCYLVLPEKSGRLALAAAYGWNDRIASTIEPMSQVGHTIATQAPVVVDDFAREMRFGMPSVMQESAIRSGLSVPMFREGEVVGAILVHSRTVKHFSDSEASILSLIANQSAIALKTALQYEAIERKNAYLSALHEAGKAITTASLGSERRQILDVFVHQAVHLVGGNKEVGAVSAFIQLYEQDTAELVFDSFYTTGPGPNLAAGSRWPLDRHAHRVGISGRVALTGTPILVADVRQDPDYVMLLPGTTSQMAVPLLDHGNVVGVLSVEAAKENAFDLEDLQTLSALAELAVVAMQNTRLYDELRLAYEELKALDEKKTEFLSTVSHELRTPLTPVQGCIQNMLSGQYGPLTPQQHDRLKLALDCVREETRLIENLLDLVRIQENRVKLDLEQGSLRSIIVAVTNMFEYAAAQNGVPLRLHLPEQDDLVALIDMDKIRRTVINLIDNAVKYSRSGGTVTIEAVRHHDQIAISVADTGIGIPAHELERVFERFYRVEGGSTRRIGGVGIGLNIAKRNVEVHGGRIWVESERDRGTVFTFSVPVPPDESREMT